MLQLKKEVKLLSQKIKNSKNVIIYGPLGSGKMELVNRIVNLSNKKDATTYYLDCKNFDLDKINNNKPANYFDQKNKKDSISAYKKVDFLVITSAESYEKDCRLNDMLFWLNKEKESYKRAFILLNLNIEDNSYITKKINESHQDFAYISNFRLDPENHLKEIKKVFKENDKKINEKIIKVIFKKFEGHYYFINHFLQYLLNTNLVKIRKIDIEQCLKNIVEANSFEYSLIKDLLSPYQYKLLKAIAKDENPNQITSTQFIEGYQLNAPSSVKTAEKALLEKNLLLKTTKGYTLLNKYYKQWLILN